MRRLFLAVAVIVLALISAQTSTPQAPAEQKTPEALIADYNQAMQAHDWAGAIASAQHLIDQSATSGHLYMLANAQLSSGAQQDSLATCDRALAAAQQEKPADGQPDAAWKDGIALIYLSKGNALLKLHRNADAVDAYTHAAELSSNPGVAYFNLCATLYNAGDMQNATPACRKAVAANPANANAWFVLSSLLFADSKTDAQGKLTVTAECREALDKYLQLAPDGPHAADVKAMLDMIAH